MKRILLIDDDQDLGELIRRKVQEAIDKTFRGWGTELVDARTLEDGRRLARTGEFDLALVDLVIPPLGLNESINLLPTLVDEFPCPIIVFTGNRTDEVRQKCIALGATSFFLKCIAIESGDALMQDCINAVARFRRQGYGRR